MKIRLFAAAAVAVVAFSGVARADDLVISETLNGTITSGSDNADIFGGGDLTGDSVSLTLSYDITLLTADGTYNGSDEYDDSTGDSSLTESITIDDQTFVQTNDYSGDEGRVLDCVSGSCGQSQFEIFAQDSESYLATYLFGSYDLDSGSLSSQSAIDSYVASLALGSAYSLPDANGDFVAGNGLGSDLLSFDVSSTPEPTTWVSLGLGLVGVALIKFRR